VRGRIIDLSKRAAEVLGYRQKGVTKVRVEVLQTASG
jgi:rare lipoprotein A (peptidoglycan hydrolase)